MNTEQVFKSIRERFQSLLSKRDSKTKLERIKEAIALEATKKAELQGILAAKTQLHDARVANNGLRERIADIDKPTSKWKPTRSENI